MENSAPLLPNATPTSTQRTGPHKIYSLEDVRIHLRTHYPKVYKCLPKPSEFTFGRYRISSTIEGNFVDKDVVLVGALKSRCHYLPMLRVWAYTTGQEVEFFKQASHGGYLTPLHDSFTKYKIDDIEKKEHFATISLGDMSSIFRDGHNVKAMVQTRFFFFIMLGFLVTGRIKHLCSPAYENALEHIGVACEMIHRFDIARDVELDSEGRTTPKYTLADITTHATMYFPEAFNSLPGLDEFTFEQFQGRNGATDLLQVGTPAHGASLSLSTIKIWTHTTGSRIAFSKQKPPGQPFAVEAKSIYNGNLHRIGYFAIVFPTTGNNSKGRARFEVFINYLFLLKGCITRVENAIPVDFLEYFRQACEMIHRHKTNIGASLKPGDAVQADLDNRSIGVSKGKSHSEHTKVAKIKTPKKDARSMTPKTYSKNERSIKEAMSERSTKEATSERPMKNKYTLEEIHAYAKLHFPQNHIDSLPNATQFTFKRFSNVSYIPGQGNYEEDLVLVGSYVMRDEGDCLAWASAATPVVFFKAKPGEKLRLISDSPISQSYIRRAEPFIALELSPRTVLSWHRQAIRSLLLAFVKYAFLLTGRITHVDNQHPYDFLDQFEMICTRLYEYQQLNEVIAQNRVLTIGEGHEDEIDGIRAGFGLTPGSLRTARHEDGLRGSDGDSLMSVMDASDRATSKGCNDHQEPEPSAKRRKIQDSSLQPGHLSDEPQATNDFVNATRPPIAAHLDDSTYDAPPLTTDLDDGNATDIDDDSDFWQVKYESLKTKFRGEEKQVRIIHSQLQERAETAEDNADHWEQKLHEEEEKVQDLEQQLFEKGKRIDDYKTECREWAEDNRDLRQKANQHKLKADQSENRCDLWEQEAKEETRKREETEKKLAGVEKKLKKLTPDPEAAEWKRKFEESEAKLKKHIRDSQRLNWEQRSVDQEKKAKEWKGKYEDELKKTKELQEQIDVSEEWKNA